MIFCKRCLMPSTRPRVVFTDGVCNACLFHDEYKKVNWDERKQEFLDLVARHKKHPVYDCIVPFSGGKDSASIAYRLRHELGLRPLLVCYGQLLWTDVGRRNLHRVADAGFDILYWRVDQRVGRALARRFFIERGHPKNHYDAAVNAVPLITAVNFGIPLVIFAEHGESFYGGHVLSEEHRRRRDLAEVLENQVGDDARNWAVDGIDERDLYPYIMPERAAEEVEAVYWSYYFRWSIYENARLARQTLGFETAQNGVSVIRATNTWATEPDKFEWGKSDGSFEGFDSIDDMIDDLDYFMMRQKFLFGRSIRMASRLIQLGVITREHGLELARKHDAEFPNTYLKQNLEYLGLTEQEFWDVVYKHRNPELWIEENGVWREKSRVE